MESFGKGLEKTKQEEWDSIVQSVDRIVDGLGERVDDGIKESVIALKAHGFGTTGSCEGHLDHGLPYPWIDVGSQLASENNHLKSRFHELWESRMRWVQGGEEMTEAEKSELKETIELETAANIEAINRLAELLNDFDDLNENKSSSLELKKRARGSARLRPSGLPVGSPMSEKEELAKLSKEETEQNLKIYQEEMDNFAKFLRDRFFE